MKARSWVWGLLLGAAPLLAQAGEAGTVYTQLGINGLGLGYATSLNDTWAVRGQYNYLPKTKYTGDVSDFGASARLTVELEWNSAQIVGDWYPLGDGFRVTGGAVFSNNKVTVAGTGNVGSTTNTTVNAEIKMSDGVAPYLGIGYGVKPKAAKGLGFNMDLGVMFQNPKASLSAPAASAADVAAKQREMQDAADKLKYFPVLAFGISYSF
ncbi:MAG: hypothetical protein ACT4NV_05465 [Rhodoferax sp.]